MIDVPGSNKLPVALRLLPLVIVPAGYLALVPWLKDVGGPATVTIISAAVAIFVMGYANYFAYSHQRKLDEVQRAGASFAAQWGMSVGQILFVLLVLLPPVQDFATWLVNSVEGDAADSGTVVFAMVLGFCGLVVLQTIGTVIVNLVWWTAKQ